MLWMQSQTTLEEEPMLDKNETIKINNQKIIDEWVEAL